MDIVFCTDNNFIMPCGVAIISLLEKNKGENIIIHLLGLNLSDNNKEKILSISEEYKVKILIYDIDNNLLENYDFPVEEIGLNRITVAAYIRLLITDILPKDLNKIIYLDCDIMVVDNLSKLWNIDLTDCSLAGVIEDLTFDPATFSRLDYPIEYSYINSGVLLINLDYWRKHNIIDKFISYLTKNRDKIIYHDQDIINGTLFESIKLCDYRYNMHTALYKKESPFNTDLENLIKERQNPVVIHYTTGKKPWYKDASNVRIKEYQKYIKKSPWRDDSRKWRINSRKHKLRFYIKTILIELGLKKNIEQELGIK